MWLLTLFSNRAEKPKPVEALPPRDRRSHPRDAASERAVFHWMGDDGEYLSQSAEVFDTSPSGMGIRLSRALPVGLTVWIAGRQPELLKGVIRRCRQEGERYFAGLFLVRIERRQSDRQPIHEAATLHWEDPTAGKQSAPVVLRNLSVEGFQLEVGKKIAAGSLVRVSFRHWECVGFTHYCRLAGGTYLVGLRITREPYPKEAAEG